ncbi:MAG: hypothetical protein U0L23_05170, partial [Lachnospiraceae bacterium]|nr:hypothetical protein [Lachnospiraceae bacterium]
MRIEANQNNLYGAATQNEKLQGKNKGKGSSYFAGDLNLGVDAIAARKKEAKRQAMKVVADAFSGDRAIDEDLEKRAERIKTLAKERDEAQNQINQIDEKKKALKSATLKTTISSTMVSYLEWVYGIIVLMLIFQHNVVSPKLSKA